MPKKFTLIFVTLTILLTATALIFWYLLSSNQANPLPEQREPKFKPQFSQKPSLQKPNSTTTTPKPSNSPTASPTPKPQEATITQATKDNLGYSENDKKAQTLLDSGAYVLNISNPNTFAVVWEPKTKPTRLLVLLHGTDGKAYYEVADELSEAQKHSYTLVGLQWFNKESKTYMTASQIMSALNPVLEYLKTQKGITPQIYVLHGFSRGSAVSYEVTHLDQNDKNWFTGTANMSGGIPINSKIEAKSANPSADLFFSKLNAGTLGSSAYNNHHFFMYCGMKDEEWGTEMCEQFQNARKLMEGSGGIVDIFIADPSGKHMGFRSNPDTRKQFISWFTTLN